MEGPKILKIDLDLYIRDTAEFTQSPAERLRQLAIHIEPEASALAGMSGWEALRRIYTCARDLDPHDPDVLISMSFSTQFLGEVCSNAKNRDRLWGMSEVYARKAVEQAPGDPRVCYALGYILYFREQKEEAIDVLGMALSSKPDSNTKAWAHLYHAHCLHDLGRWEAALASYDRVDRSKFTGGRAWRIDVLGEQRAYCLHMLGRINEASEILNRIFDRYEREPHLAFDAMSSAFWSVVEAGPADIVERAKRIDRLACSKVIGE